MHVLPLIYRPSTQALAVEVRAALEKLGCEVDPIELVSDDDIFRSMMPPSKATSGVSPISAWIVPSDAVFLELLDRDNAEANRSFIGLPNKDYSNSARLMIIADEIANYITHHPGMVVTTGYTVLAGLFDVTSLEEFGFVRGPKRPG
jgi:hypothetical protein